MKDVYIIHGWAYSVEPWTEVVGNLNQAGYNPVLLNVPGLTSPSKDVWTISGYVDWLHVQLKGVASPIIIGHSNGGRIALNYDLAHPGRIKKLILISSAGVVSGGGVRLRRKVLSAMAKVLSPLKRVPGLQKVVRKLSGAGDYAAAPPNMKITLQNMLSSDSQLDIAGTTAPISLVWGDADTVTPLWMAHSIQAFRQGTRLHTLAGASHAPYKSHPELLSDALITILQGEA